MWCLKGVDLLLCDVSVRLDEVLVKWLELGEVASASHAVHRLLALATGVTVQVSLEHVFRHEMAAAFGLNTSVPVTDRKKIFRKLKFQIVLKFSDYLFRLQANISVLLSAISVLVGKVLV